MLLILAIPGLILLAILFSYLTTELAAFIGSMALFVYLVWCIETVSAFLKTKGIV